jgi:hypothetical protein
MKQHKILLNDAELAKIIHLSHLRNDWKEQGGARSNKVSDASERSVHELGLLGEMCFSRWSGLAVDESEQRSGDAGFDFTMRCGLTVDVKTHSLNYGDLRLISKDVGSLKADVAVLVTQCGGGGILRGWATKCSILNQGVIMNFLGGSHNDRLVLKQGKLFNMDKLSFYDNQRVDWDSQNNDWLTVIRSHGAGPVC